MGLELSGVIDPDLNWKIATKGRRRAVRRARTSFIEGNKNNCTVKTSMSSKHISDIESTEDASVSESEKVGVSILGQRFSESLKSIPIKKRQLLLSCSPSPPSPYCHSDYFDDFSISQTASFHGTLAYDKHHKKRPSKKRSTPKKRNGKACDTADFSGISILASAACNSDAVSDIINAEGFNSKDQYSNRDAQSNSPSPHTDSLCQEKVQHMLISETLERKHNIPIVTCSDVSVEIIDGLPSNKSSMTQLQDDSDKLKPSSCDPKHNWDLNTAMMDAWDSSCDEIANCQPLATDHRVKSCQSERNSALKTGKSEVDAVCVSEFENHIDVGGSSMDNHVALKAKAEKEHDIFNVKLSDSKEAKQCSVSCGYENDEMDQQLDVAIVSLVSSTEETTHVDVQSINICGVKNNSPTDEAFVSYPAKSDEVSTSVDIEPTAILISGENASCHTIPQKSHFSLDESLRERVSCENPDENKSIDKSNVESNSDEHCLIDSCLGSVVLINSQIESNIDMHKSDNTNDYPSTNHLDDIASKETGDQNFCMNTNPTYDMSGDVAHSVGLVIAQEHHGDESYTAHDATYKLDTVDQKDGDHECAILSDSNLLPAMSPRTRSLQDVASIVDNAVGIKVESKCYLASYVSISVGGGLDDDLQCTSVTKSAKNDANQTNGMEKIDLLDDDSQYEDGEFRESVIHGWEDASEEEEIEHLDYGSDNRENDVFEPPSSVPPICLSADGMACKDAKVTTCDGSHLCKDMKLTIYHPLLKCSSMSEGLESGNAKSGAGRIHTNYLGINGGRKSQQVVGDVSVLGIVTNNIPGNIVNNCSMEASTSTRMKMSGWDQLPESCSHTKEKLSDSAIASTKNPSRGSFDAFGNCESFMRSGSSFKRDLSSQIERPISSNEAQRDYGRVSRSDDRNLDANAKGDAGVPSLNETYGQSLHTQGRESGDNWFEPSSHCVPRNHDSSAYYRKNKFSQSGLRNATAAVVAKVENSGFVVAPDGTIVKSGGVGTAGQLPRRSAKSPLHASKHSISKRGPSRERNHTCDMWKRLPRSREMSPDRHSTDDHEQIGRYDREMVRNRYHRPIPDSDNKSDLVYLPRRDRNILPHRWNMQLSRSHSRSRSRSRTRSPRHWTSPKAGSGVRMRGGPVLRRRSRSPLIFKQDARMGRMRSPHQQPNYGDRIMSYGSRIRSSLSYTPSDSRRESPDHFRELEYRQDSGSTATMRMLRNQRFISMDSQGRLKPDENYYPPTSRKVPRFSGFGGGSCQDEIQDRRRRHIDRYELSHLPHKRDMSSIKRARYDVEGSFHNHSITGFRRMGSPRNFYQRTHNRYEDSPDKVEEKPHYGYDDKFSKPRSSFNSYEVQEHDDGVATQGRSS